MYRSELGLFGAHRLRPALPQLVPHICQILLLLLLHLPSEMLEEEPFHVSELLSQEISRELHAHSLNNQAGHQDYWADSLLNLHASTK
jgi:hypothetical protein